MAQFQVLPPLEHPPTVPMPEELRRNQSPESSPRDDGTVIGSTLAELQQAQTIFCKFWIIVNEIFFIYRDSTLGARSLGFALGKYRKLLELADNLPKSMLRIEKTPHWVLILQ